MSKPVKIVVFLVVLVVGLWLGVGLLAKSLVSGSGLQSVLARFEDRLPVAVSVGAGDFDFAEWVRLRPAISIEDVKIANPEGFREESLFSSSNVSAQVSLLSLFGDNIEILSIRLDDPVVHLETKADGSTNVETVLAGIESGSEEAPEEPVEGESQGVAIQQFQVRNGTLHYLEAGAAEGVSVGGIDLTLSDFEPDSSCKIAFAAHPFEGGKSLIEYSGNAGPFGGTALPMSGVLDVDIAPDEIPAEVRSELFGTVLGYPGESSDILFTSTMSGDLLGEFTGDGKLTLSEFWAGKDEEHRLPLTGEAPVTIRADKLAADPKIRADISQATLQLGEGQWKGSANMRFDGKQFIGGSKGSIAGVDINQLLSAFTDQEDELYGQASIPDYTIRFRGATAEEIQNSLQGGGNLQLNDGKIAILDMLQTIEQHAKKLLSGEAPPADGETAFAQLATRFEIRDQKVVLPELVLDGGNLLKISGEGGLTFDQELDFDLMTNVTGQIAQLLGGQKDESGAYSAAVPVTVKGSTMAPAVRPAIGRLVTNRAKSEGKKLFNSFLKRLTTPDEEAPAEGTAAEGAVSGAAEGATAPQ